MEKKFIDKFDSILEEYNSLKLKLSKFNIINDKKNFISISKEISRLYKIIEPYLEFKSLEKDLNYYETYINDPDLDLKKIALDEILLLKEKKNILYSKLYSILSNMNTDSYKSVFLELRAATGGKEAAIFVGDLLNMYLSYSNFKTWKTEIISCNYTEHDGYKDIIIRISEGSNIYSKIKYESGIHRVQRVPKTDNLGRIHTSTCTVAVLPEFHEINDIDINPSELRIDTYRASGAGGQHVNRTDSAVRVIHIPSGIMAECQAERSQHKNKAKAMSLLYSRLLTRKRDTHKSDIDKTRKLLVGSGSRSEKIRTYNYIQNRVTDHRINITLYKLADIMNGNLNLILDQFLS